VTKLQDARFRKTDFTADKATEFDSDMLTILMAIDENKSIVEIAKETKMNPAVFKEGFLRLYKLKFIEEVKETQVFVDSSFVQSLREVLVGLVGPLGEVLLDEAAEMMDLQISKVPKSRIADLVYEVAKGIPGNKQQEEFKKIMLQKMKNMA
jgi:DNA-binding transcriptional regulator YhcF (GntR family)